MEKEKYLTPTTEAVSFELGTAFICSSGQGGNLTSNDSYSGYDEDVFWY